MQVPVSLMFLLVRALNQICLGFPCYTICGYSAPHDEPTYQTYLTLQDKYNHKPVFWAVMMIAVLPSI